ncbi:MAG: HlyC/CorC family transporter [Methanotrichaceae archaeon]|nr:HlyC/CorC family transporter [Methanotrichaceae archaeon]
MYLEILIILLLIIINGIFSMSEIAVVSARKALLRKRAEDGDANAGLALKLGNEPTQFLSTVQIGITLVGILAGAFGGATIASELSNMLSGSSVLSPYSDAISIFIVVLAVTYLTLILGELVPKRIGLSSPEDISSRMAPSMSALSKIASPIIWLLSGSTEAVVRLFGIKPYVEPTITEEEIRILIDQGTTAGVIEEEEKDIMERVFLLGDRRAESIMTPRSEIVWLDIDDAPEEVQRKITSSPYSLFPVSKRRLDSVMGVVKAKDLLPCSIRDHKVDLRSSLLPPLIIPESMRALKVLERFKQTGIHIAVVIDEFGSVRGIVTLTNILEAMVGDIPHIEELAEPQLVEREDGSWLVDGTLSIQEFKEALQIKDELPEENAGLYQTMAGFVMMQLEKLPATGDHFQWNGYRFEVVDMDANRIDKLLVAPQDRHKLR